MTDRDRRRLFGAAGLLVVGSAVLPLLLGGEGGTAPGRPTTGQAAPIVQGIGREEQRLSRARRPAPMPRERAANEDRPVRSRAAARGLEAAEAAARAFLSALLRRESGEGRQRERRLIARGGSADFAHFVLGDEPRVPAATDAPAQARLVDLEPVGIGYGRAELAATIERDGARSGLLVALARREGRWRIADLR
jgi:hypothetical protein